VLFHRRLFLRYNSHENQASQLLPKHARVDARFRSKTREALSEIGKQHDALVQQVNASGIGEPTAPPKVGSLAATASHGFAAIAIHDPGALYPGVKYTVEHADNAAMTDQVSEPMGPARVRPSFRQAGWPLSKHRSLGDRGADLARARRSYCLGACRIPGKNERLKRRCNRWTRRSIQTGG
jgi:hypothetical protein